MKNGLKRYYKIWNRDPGPSYYIFDRTTGKKVFEDWNLEKAEVKVRELNEADQKEKGVVNDAVEVPPNYSGFRDRTPKEIAPMVRHK